MATWRFEIALLVLKNILLASPLTCEIFFNTQREISYLNMTLYYPLLPSPSTFPFHPFPSFLAPYPLLPTFSPPSGFLIYLSCPLYVHPLLYFLTLELLLSIFFPLFLLLVLFVLPLHTPCVLSSTFPAPITSTLSLPLQLFLSIFSPFFPPSLSSSSYLFTPPSFFLIYLSCPPILPPLLSLIVLSELFKCLTSVMILCNHAV